MEDSTMDRCEEKTPALRQQGGGRWTRVGERDTRKLAKKRLQDRRMRTQHDRLKVSITGIHPEMCHAQ